MHGHVALILFDRKMFYFKNPNVQNTDWYFILDNVFDESELSLIEQIANNTESIEAEVGNNAEPDKMAKNNEVRSSTVKWLSADDNESINPIYKKLGDAFSWVNNSKFKFDLQFIETIQHTEYKQQEFFNWHTDGPPHNYDNSPIRKLSASVLLTEDYEGGDFEFSSIGTMRLKRNQAVFFPSMLAHRITPITQGTRKSLVAWARGNPFI